MAETLSEKLRDPLVLKHGPTLALLEEAAAELDRREAIVAAAEAWAKAELEHRRVLQDGEHWTIYYQQTREAATALLALLSEDRT